MKYIELKSNDNQLKLLKLNKKFRSLVNFRLRRTSCGRRPIRFFRRRVFRHDIGLSSGPSPHKQPPFSSPRQPAAAVRPPHGRGGEEPQRHRPPPGNLLARQPAGLLPPAAPQPRERDQLQCDVIQQPHGRQRHERGGFLERGGGGGGEEDARGDRREVRCQGGVATAKRRFRAQRPQQHGFELLAVPEAGESPRLPSATGGAVEAVAELVQGGRGEAELLQKLRREKPSQGRRFSRSVSKI